MSGIDFYHTFIQMANVRYRLYASQAGFILSSVSGSGLYFLQSKKPSEDKMNPLQELNKFGQSIWLDYIRRNLFASGELKRLVTEDGILGVTSNPSIFEKAIAGSTDYQDAILEFSGRDDVDAKSRNSLHARCEGCRRTAHYRHRFVRRQARARASARCDRHF